MLPWKDWKGKTVVDIGGGSGTVLSAVKAAEPSIRAISFDLPAAISKDGEVEGVEMVAGDMFDPATIPASDIYFMKHILHDWSDEDALRVLRSIHQAGGAGSRLILAEGIVPEPGDEDLFMGKVMYIDMILMLIGGKERSRPEWSALLGQAGWLIDEVVNTPGPLCQLIVCSQA